MSGLSIDFIARDWSPRVPRGRELREIELPEVSLVTSPMLPGAAICGRGFGLGEVRDADQARLVLFRSEALRDARD